MGKKVTYVDPSVLDSVKRKGYVADWVIFYNAVSTTSTYLDYELAYSEDEAKYIADEVDGLVLPLR
jgi:hypothetical protein